MNVVTKVSSSSKRMLDKLEDSGGVIGYRLLIVISVFAIVYSIIEYSLYELGYSIGSAMALEADNALVFGKMDTASIQNEFWTISKWRFMVLLTFLPFAAAWVRIVGGENKLPPILKALLASLIISLTISTLKGDQWFSGFYIFISLGTLASILAKGVLRWGLIPAFFTLITLTVNNTGVIMTSFGGLDLPMNIGIVLSIMNFASYYILILMGISVVSLAKVSFESPLETD